MRRALLLTLVMLAGCSRSSKPEDKVIGTWIGDPPMVAQMKKDPQLQQFAGMMEDSVRLDLKPDHTYSLQDFDTRSGKWEMTARVIKFVETDSHSFMPSSFDDQFQFGSVSKEGARSYSAVVSADDKKVTLFMGKLGDVEFHR
jgi:hypothetical protein